MKNSKSNFSDITKKFDRELREILLNDLKAFKANKGRFLKNNKNNQNDLLVA